MRCARGQLAVRTPVLSAAILRPRGSLRRGFSPAMLSSWRTMQSLDEIARDVLDSLHEGCVVVGFDWKFLYVNDALVRHARLPRDKLLGRTMMECYPGLELQP